MWSSVSTNRSLPPSFLLMLVNMFYLVIDCVLYCFVFAVCVYFVDLLCPEIGVENVNVFVCGNLGW